jgi:hypothetical protein
MSKPSTSAEKEDVQIAGIADAAMKRLAVIEHVLCNALEDQSDGGVGSQVT